jgi:hypothetical protein
MLQHTAVAVNTLLLYCLLSNDSLQTFSLHAAALTLVRANRFLNHFACHLSLARSSLTCHFANWR